MARTKGKQSKESGNKGWKINTKDGRLLTKLLEKGTVSAGITPTALCEQYPQFKKYKGDSLGAGLRRLKDKLGVNARGEEDSKFHASCYSHVQENNTHQD